LPNVALCLNSSCVKINECFRYLAKPDNEQLYNMRMEMICNKNNDYGEFIKVKKGDKLNKSLNKVKN